MNLIPSVNGHSGRGPNGRFAKGNPGGPGNPHSRRVQELRTVLLKKVTDQDLMEVVDVLIKLAKGGDLAAIRELLDRTIGRAAHLLEAIVETSSGADPEDPAMLAEAWRTLGLPDDLMPPAIQAMVGRLKQPTAEAG